MCQLLILVLLNSGRRVGEIAAFTKDYLKQEGDVVFSFGFQGLLLNGSVTSKFGSQSPLVFPLFKTGVLRLCPIRAFKLYLKSEPSLLSAMRTVRGRSGKLPSPTW